MITTFYLYTQLLHTISYLRLLRPEDHAQPTSLGKGHSSLVGQLTKESML